MKKENLKIWNAVAETDPRFTKKVNQRGGFTAINSQYQKRLATAMFGPYGSKWGVKNLVFGFYPKGDECYLEAVFYYPDGEFEIAVDMVYRLGNDTRKKLLTDLTTKALSMLGFNADVFLGMYDDNKYIQELRQKYNNQNGAAAPAPPKTTKPAAPKIKPLPRINAEFYNLWNGQYYGEGAQKYVQIGKHTFSVTPEQKAALDAHLAAKNGKGKSPASDAGLGGKVQDIAPLGLGERFQNFLLAWEKVYDAQAPEKRDAFQKSNIEEITKGLTLTIDGIVYKMTAEQGDSVQTFIKTTADLPF